MQACHKDKMRFNILDGKSSVVWPSSLLPGLESKWWEEKGDLFAMLRMLFSPHPFHFLLSSLPQFLQHFFFYFTVSLFPLSPPLLLHLFPPTIQFLSCFATSTSSSLSHSCISSSRAQSRSPDVSLKLKKSPPSPSPDTFDFYSIPSTGVFKWQTAHWK